MGFSSPQYQFSEGAGSLPESVYIEKENAITVSSNFIVTVVLQTTSTATYGRFLAVIIHIKRDISVSYIIIHLHVHSVHSK